MRRKTIEQRLQYGVARLLSHLPARAQIALSGEPALVIDGAALDPQVQLLRSIRRRRGFTGLIDPSIEAGRRRFRRDAHVFRGPMTAVEAVRDFEIPGPAGPLRVRHYAPADTREPAPLTVYLHGGGFVIGDLDTHDEPCRRLCRHARVHVLSVDYRLAPEHRFPAAVDDAQAAFDWGRAHAAMLGADPGTVAVGGDSAGANLAAAVALTSAVRPVAQLLIYPAVDPVTPRPSHDRFGDGFLLTRRDRDAFLVHYTGGAAHPLADPRLSLLTANLSGAPPALIVVAGFDILRDEGEALAVALAAADNRVMVERCPLEHGFIHLTGVCRAARRAVIVVAEQWGTLLRSRVV